MHKPLTQHPLLPHRIPLPHMSRHYWEDSHQAHEQLVQWCYLNLGTPAWDDSQSCDWWFTNEITANKSFMPVIHVRDDQLKCAVMLAWC